MDGVNQNPPSTADKFIHCCSMLVPSLVKVDGKSLPCVWGLPPPNNPQGGVPPNSSFRLFLISVLNIPPPTTQSAQGRFHHVPHGNMYTTPNTRTCIPRLNKDVYSTHWNMGV